jgi:5-methylcytosine-specific restriction endonuclease McrA
MSKNRSGRQAALAHQIALELAERRGWLCHWCAATLTPSTVTADHLVPVSEGGGNGRENIVAACKRCNSARGRLGDLSRIANELVGAIKRTHPQAHPRVVAMIEADR